jgi:DNA-binding LytR/AlgR family response regulator
MDNLFAATCTLLAWILRKVQITSGYPAPLCFITGWPACSGITGRIRLEWVAGLQWNGWLIWTGIRKMPGIDGVETCRRLRAEEQTRYIPVIMVTAFGTTETEATDAGADDLINKPFNLTDLAVRVKSLLRIGHLSDPVQRLMTYMDELDANRPD